MVLVTLNDIQRKNDKLPAVILKETEKHGLVDSESFTFKSSKVREIHTHTTIYTFDIQERKKKVAVKTQLSRSVDTGPVVMTSLRSLATQHP